MSHEQRHRVKEVSAGLEGASKVSAVVVVSAGWRGQPSAAAVAVAVVVSAGWRLEAGGGKRGEYERWW
jgi:hypothetical protein